jgi:predicted nucleic acid-binding protein
MIVVSDTSPITALLAIGEEDLLHDLFGGVVIPPAVQRELLRGHIALPSWLQVVQVQDSKRVQRLLGSLDAGESEAIVLAGETHADILLIDERKGRRLAVAEGIGVIGLVGVVLLAKKRGRIESAGDLLQRLSHEAGMYLAEGILRTALQSVGE